MMSSIFTNGWLYRSFSCTQNFVVNWDENYQFDLTNFSLKPGNLVVKPSFALRSFSIAMRSLRPRLWRAETCQDIGWPYFHEHIQKLSDRTRGRSLRFELLFRLSCPILSFKSQVLPLTLHSKGKEMTPCIDNYDFLDLWALLLYTRFFYQRSSRILTK